MEQICPEAFRNRPGASRRRDPSCDLRRASTGIKIVDAELSHDSKVNRSSGVCVASLTAVFFYLFSWKLKT